MRYLAIIFGIAGLSLSPILPNVAEARPVSYPEGWTLIVGNDVNQNSALIHYTLDTEHSLGLRLRYDREGDFVFTGAQVNRLIKRWNNADSQANIYGHVAIGRVSDNLDESELRPERDNDAGLFIGASADWETRRYFVSAAAEHWESGRFGEFSTFHGRLGIAPYVANTGALHTWFMVEGLHRPESRDPVSARALLRFFKGPALLEAGIDDTGEPLLNYIHRF